MGQNGMRPMVMPNRQVSQKIEKPKRGEEVATADGKTFVVLATGMKYVDVWDVAPVPSKVKHLIKISDVVRTGNILDVD